MDNIEKIVKILDGFPYDLKDYSGNNTLFMVDDHIELAKYLVSNDVRPVVHAQWLPQQEIAKDINGVHMCRIEYCCSNCKAEELLDSDYCPSCGAKMNYKGERHE